MLQRLPNTEGDDSRGWMRRSHQPSWNEVPLRDEVYYRMLLSTDIDERVELLWCGAQYYSSIWIAATLAKRERGRMVPSWRWEIWRDITSSWHIIIITRPHIFCFNALYPISNHQNTSNRDHIRCKEKSVVNHDGYPPSWTFIRYVLWCGSTRAFYF